MRVSPPHPTSQPPRSWPWWLALFLALGPAGCGDPANQGGGSEIPPEIRGLIENKPAARRDDPRAGSIRLGAVLPSFEHPFYAAQKRALERAAKLLGAVIDVRDSLDDDRTQIGQVETLIRLGCNAIILCPIDEEALVPAVEQANRARVPVITLNRRVNGGVVVAYVGPDDEDGGKAQARLVVEALGPRGGQVLYLQGRQGSSTHRLRNEAFRSVLSGHRGIKVVEDRSAGSREDQADLAMIALTRRFKPGTIQAIVAQSDEMAVPAAEIVREAGWTDVAVIGCDGSEHAFEAIRGGLMRATLLQDPAQQADWAVKAAVDHLSGKLVPFEQLTPLPVITKSSLERYRPAY